MAARSRVRPDQRQDNRAGRELVRLSAVGSAVAIEAHKPRAAWLKATRDAWSDLWGSDVAKAIARHHLPAVYRLFDFRDAQTRALRLYSRQPMVDGSMGQPVSSPAMAVVQRLEKSIVALEDRIGLTPKAQANLGIAIGGAALTAAELNKMAAEADDGDDDGDEVEEIVEAEWEDAL